MELAKPYVPPPMREKYPTLPYDLSEYARLHTGPGSWTDETIDQASIVSGPMLRWSDVLRITITAEEFREHALDRREALILSVVDGARTVESVCEVAGLPEDEALALLCDLRERGVLAVEAA